MNKWERKFGKYAIPNLTTILIGCYVVGYILNIVSPTLLNYLRLDPYAILHGQIWRIVTWVISPPSTVGSSMDIFFVAIMLFFYYSLGTSLERIWGTWKYNVYLFTGMLLTVAGSFLCFGIYSVMLSATGSELSSYLPVISSLGALQISTYYINMSIFLAFAATFPNAQVLLMFVIPVKVKWMGYLYAGMLVYEMIQYFAVGYWFAVAAIGASLLNFVIFIVRNKNGMRLSPKQKKRQAEFRQEVKQSMAPRVTKHKCAVCGQTNEDDPDLEFRFCSKCNGNYEYCSNHLFTHEHVK